MGDVYYDQIASGYAELHDAEQRAKAELVLQNLNILPNDRLLDVGCGSGSSSSLFACKKFGLDPSFELLKRASFPVVQGKAEFLPFPVNSFEIVLSLTAVHNFGDVEKGLREMARVSSRDVVVSVLKKSFKFSEIEKLINTILKVRKRIEEQHDVIFLCRKSLNNH